MPFKSVYGSFLARGLDGELSGLNYWCTAFRITTSASCSSWMDIGWTLCLPCSFFVVAPFSLFWISLLSMCTNRRHKSECLLCTATLRSTLLGLPELAKMAWQWWVIWPFWPLGHRQKDQNRWLLVLTWYRTQSLASKENLVPESISIKWAPSALVPRMRCLQDWISYLCTSIVLLMPFLGFLGLDWLQISGIVSRCLLFSRGPLCCLSRTLLRLFYLSF